MLQVFAFTAIKSAKETAFRKRVLIVTERFPTKLSLTRFEQNPVYLLPETYVHIFNELVFSFHSRICNAFATLVRKAIVCIPDRYI